ncbi:TPA: hypothetical protein ACGOYW_001680 [Streptococcus suis]
MPKTSHDLLHELSQKGTVSYRNTWKNLVLALVILISGAGVGPEASLLGAVLETRFGPMVQILVPS